MKPETAWKEILRHRTHESEILQQPDSPQQQQRLIAIRTCSQSITDDIRFNFDDIRQNMPIIDTSRGIVDDDYLLLSAFITVHLFSPNFVTLSSFSISDRLKMEKMIFLTVEQEPIPRTITHTLKKLEGLPSKYYLYLLTNTACHFSLVNIFWGVFSSPLESLCVAGALSLLLLPIVSNDFLQRCATSFLMRDCYEIAEAYSDIAPFNPAQKALIRRFTNWETGIKAAYLNFFTGARTGDYAHFRDAQFSMQRGGPLPAQLATYAPFFENGQLKDTDGFAFIDHV